MAAYTTSYDDLVADLQDITESTEPEFVLQIPKIIARAQDVVQRDLGLEIWRSFSSVSTVNGVNTITRQASWLQVHSISIPTIGAYPEQRKLDFLRMYGTTSGTPKYWAEVSETSIQLAPTPNAVFALSVEVLERLPALAGGNQTNWLTTHAADLLLLQALIGAGWRVVSWDAPGYGLSNLPVPLDIDHCARALALLAAGADPNVRDGHGLIHEVWILTPQEAALKRPVKPT